MYEGQRVCAIIPAAGSGTRMGGKAKHLLCVKGKPVIAYSLELFQRLPIIDAIMVAASAQTISETRNIAGKYKIAKLIDVMLGGEHRQDSVWNCLKSLNEKQFGLVLVHDAARPFVDEDIVRRVVEAASQHGGAIAAVRAKDTIKLAEDGFVAETLNRDKVWQVQTPQGFKSELLRRAFFNAQASGFIGTDEASIVEKLDEKVRIVESSYENIKITTPQDLEIAELMADAKM
jgi:2-C-methyl-D-erythritol 4-phosphate cytidylyltransferase